MPEPTKISISSFEEKLGQVIDEIGVKDILLRDDYFKEFCELTGHDYSECICRDLAPPGFMMTLTGSTIGSMFLKFFTKFPTVIKGVIHSKSKVEYLAPIVLSAKNFKETIAIKNVEEKSGKKGEYFVVDFEVALMDESGSKLAIDFHQFFLRV